MICLDNDVLRKFVTSDPDQKVVSYLGRGATLATANKHDFEKSPIHQLLNVDTEYTDNGDTRDEC